ncbi:MAG: hypothetical protein M5U28_33125 [Sandaracinaceae bacterium]|nr:hypothetical protein [Sandaracinaceae bacterium]
MPVLQGDLAHGRHEARVLGRPCDDVAHRLGGRLDLRHEVDARQEIALRQLHEADHAATHERRDPRELGGGEAPERRGQRVGARLRLRARAPEEDREHEEHGADPADDLHERSDVPALQNSQRADRPHARPFVSAGPAMLCPRPSARAPRAGSSQ